jgi:hypothetical protein
VAPETARADPPSPVCSRGGPPARARRPPWSCNGDPGSADFGTLYAYPAHVGWSLYYDRGQHRFAFSTTGELERQVVHAARRWDVVRLTASDERELRRAETVAPPERSDWNARALAEARARASTGVEQLTAEQLEAFERGAVLAALDQAVAALRQAQEAYGRANDVDARLYAEACDRLTELRLSMLRLAAPHARACAERDHADAREALEALEDDLAGEHAA